MTARASLRSGSPARPAAAGLALRKVQAEMRAPALAAAEAGLGDEPADEQEIARLDTAARHGAELQPSFQPKDGVDRAAQTRPVADDPHPLPHDPLQRLERRIGRLLVDRQGRARLAAQRPWRWLRQIVPQAGAPGPRPEDQAREKRVARQA